MVFYLTSTLILGRLYHLCPHILHYKSCDLIYISNVKGILFYHWTQWVQFAIVWLQNGKAYSFKGFWVKDLICTGFGRGSCWEQSGICPSCIQLFTYWVPSNNLFSYATKANYLFGTYFWTNKSLKKESTHFRNLSGSNKTNHIYTTPLFSSIYYRLGSTSF